MIQRKREGEVGGGSEVVFEGFVQVPAFCKERSRRLVRIGAAEISVDRADGSPSKLNSARTQIYTKYPNKDNQNCYWMPHSHNTQKVVSIRIKTYNTDNLESPSYKTYK